MDFLNKLREAIDVETVGDKPEYPLPTPYEDVLNNARNIQDYIFAKRILEHPEINKVLENMDAFSKLNKFDINTYKDLANQVADAVKAYDEENKDTEFVSEINLFENVEVVNSEELNEFQELFLLEFIGNSMMSNISQMAGNMPKTGMNDPKVGMDTDVTTSGSDGKFDDVPVKANSWLDKLMQKLGVNTGELALLTVIHHFMNKNKENKASKEQSYGMNDLKQTMPSPSQGEKEPAMAMESLTDEDNNLDKFFEWLKSGEGDRVGVMKESDDEYYISSSKEIDDIRKNISEMSDVDLVKTFKFLYSNIDNYKGKSNKKMMEDTMDEIGDVLTKDRGVSWSSLIESDDGFMKVKSNRPKRTVDRVTKNVKDDVKQRIKELDDLIAKYNEKKHFYGDVKPEIFDAKEVLNVIMDKLKSGSEESFKEAQLHFQKVESRIFHLFPPSLIKFLSHQSDGSDSVGEEIKVKTT